MQKATLVAYSVPEKFIKQLEEAEDLVEKDNNYLELKKQLETRYKRKTKQNKFKSLKYRFMVSFYLRYQPIIKQWEESQNGN